jgi:hypothetical protein
LDLAESEDEQLDYCTFYGGTGFDVTRGAALLDDQRVCLVGFSEGPDFPCVGACLNEHVVGGADAYIAVINTSLPGPLGLRYATLFGGWARDWPTQCVLVTGTNKVVVSGTTESRDFPGTADGFQSGFGGDWDLFLAEFDLTFFRRGDSNSDGNLDIADAIFTLSYLFAEGAAPTCLDAADANDDGAVNIADAIAVLSHLFAGSGDLPEPFAACGTDPTVDHLDCARFGPCEGP